MTLLATFVGEQRCHTGGFFDQPVLREGWCGGCARNQRHTDGSTGNP
ncbi:MAG: hypothetical protein ACYCU7_18820 [Acidimicrobiales bacterium]